MMNLARLALWVISLCLLSVSNHAAYSQASYPNRPIRVILPFPAGGPGDNAFRILGKEMSVKLGQPLVFENHVGGTGIMGQDLAARSAPDGYTLVALTISGALAYQGLGRNVDYLKDFTMIGQIYSQYGLLVVNPDVAEMAGIRSLRDLIAYAKAHPGKINYASQGTGSVGHLVMEDIKALTGIDVVHVPYRGVAPAYNDLLAGHIQMMSSSLGALPYIRAGKLRAIAIGSPQRSPLFPTYRRSANRDCRDSFPVHGSASAHHHTRRPRSSIVFRPKCKQRWPSRKSSN